MYVGMMQFLFYLLENRVTEAEQRTEQSEKAQKNRVPNL
jgi:hypothetical protein